jgi:hypothetical protein
MHAQADEISEVDAEQGGRNAGRLLISVLTAVA